MRKIMDGVFVTIGIPVYNAEKYIEECINSILIQTYSHFELLIVDDGSTDNTVSIIKEKFSDPRIRLICSKHNYIQTCNLLLKEAKGDYFARMDSDDIMVTDRIEVQVRYLNEHPDIDIVGGNISYFGSYIGDNCVNKKETMVTLEDCKYGCTVSHPTVMLRLERLRANDLFYDADFIYAEDYHLWVRCLINGLKIVNINQILTKYRLSDTQISRKYLKEQCQVAKKVQKVASRWLSRYEERYAVENPVMIQESGKELTIIIPFLNEKEEVRNTIRSIVETIGYRAEIMVINDQSDDGYDYRKDLSEFNVSYIYNVDRLGVAASRDKGVTLCKTPYFLLLDAHMRFYDHNWYDNLLSALKSNQRALLCCQTRILKKRSGSADVEEALECPKTYGAHCTFNKKTIFPDIDWNYFEINKDSEIEEIPAILGAGYSTSKRYWQYLKGLRGLKCYGSDESYISWKVWLEGGKCLLIKNVEIGHIYRDNSPYKRYSEEELYNNLMIASLLFPLSVQCMAEAVAICRDRNLYKLAEDMLIQNESEIAVLRDYYQTIFSIPFDKILKKHKERDLQVDVFFEKNVRRLKDVACFLEENIPVDHGLFEGKAGLTIWFCYFSKYSAEEKWDDLAGTLWQDIESSVLKQQLPFNFKYGLAGIGWALIYLSMHGFIDEAIDSLIGNIDNQLLMLDPLSISDNSLELGIGGLLAYFSARLMFNTDIIWKNNFKIKLMDRAEKLIENNNSITLCYYAKMFLKLSSDEFDPVIKGLPQIRDWLEFSNYLPEDRKFWRISMVDGCLNPTLGVVINTIGKND